MYSKTPTEKKWMVRVPYANMVCSEVCNDVQMA